MTKTVISMALETLDANFLSLPQGQQDSTIDVLIYQFKLEKIEPDDGVRIDFGKIKFLFLNETFKTAWTWMAPSSYNYALARLFSVLDASVTKEELINFLDDKTSSGEISTKDILADVDNIEMYENTGNQEVAGWIVEYYLSVDLRNIGKNTVTNVDRLIGFAFKNRLNEMSEILRKNLLEAAEYFSLNSRGLNNIATEMPESVGIVYEICKEIGDFTVIDDALIGGKTKTNLWTTMNFPSKEDVFEMLDRLDGGRVNYYKNAFSVPKDSTLTEEDLEIYGEFLNPNTIIYNVTYYQAKAHTELFSAVHLMRHPDFVITDFNTLMIDPAVMAEYLDMTNLTIEELNSIGSKLTLIILNGVNQLVSEELFQKIKHTGKFDSLKKWNDDTSWSIERFLVITHKRKKFTLDFIKDVQKYYNVSIADIYKILLKYSDRENNMDERAKKVFAAMEKLYSN